MKKDKYKVETKYSTVLKVGENYESLEIVQEEGVPDRDAIKINLYQERWRTPEDMIELLEKVIIVIRENFTPELNNLKENK